MLQPLDKRIVVRPIIPPKKESVIIVKDESPASFEIVAIGDDVTKVNIGDKVLIAAFSTSEVTYEGQKYIIVNETNIIAKVV